MLLDFVIGHLAADAQVQNKDGRQFTTFRVANTDRWTDQAGTQHENTEWVDCIINGDPAVRQYLKRGTQIAVIGTSTLRIYSSAKDRCMKAGRTVNVLRVELLSGKTDEIPSRLYTTEGEEVTVNKYYAVDGAYSSQELMSRHGQRFLVADGGWVMSVPEEQETEQEPNG